MSEILQRLANEILVYDGAMGTLLQEKSLLLPGKTPEELNISKPEEIEAIHKLYVDAGSTIIETNTFGGLRKKLANFGLEEKWKDINANAVTIARRAAHGKAYVAAGVGPFEKMVAPLGPVSFEEAVLYYKEWTEIVANAGADLVLFETFSDIKELKAAIIGAREVCDLPIQAQLTYADGNRTVTGTPPDVAAVTLSAMDIQIIGANCSAGPQDMLMTAEYLTKFTDKYVVVQPNAGLPQLIDDKTVFLETPEVMAAFAKKYVACGVNIIGGCCGSTPEHIRAMKAAVTGLTPLKRKSCVRFGLTSRTKLLLYDNEKRPIVIGERINPTGKKQFSDELREGKTTSARRFAIEQTKNGAHALDVNVGAADVDEEKMMRSIVSAVQTVSELPLVIDSIDPNVIEAGLKEYAGKVLINSVNGEEKSISAILPLAKKYGAAVLGLTTDSDGLAKTIAKRFDIAKTIKDRAESLFINANDIIIDPLTLTISVEQEQAGFTLKAIEKIKNELGLLTSLGVSNISFGLPNRSIINAHFLELALGFGLDCAIVNPNNEDMMRVVKEFRRRNPVDEEIKKFVADSLEMQFKVVPKPAKKKKHVNSDTPIDELLKEAILLGDKENILTLVEEALRKGISALDVNLKHLIPAIQEVGKKFEAREYFLPQVIMAAETMQRATARLNQELKHEEQAQKEKIIMATVEGDIHDIGKNIVIAVLESHGFKVIDLGRDVNKDAIVEAVLQNNSTLVGLSALMTTTMVQMGHIITALKEKNPNIDVIVGGAAVTPRFAAKINASGYAKDAIEAVSVVDRIFNSRQ